ncbi:MAG: 30S ribosomal protein S9 [Leptospiraceae bacterium]|jgi:small subunit ribosomal protein S9|nr:30S ribosomal protein S9 [Leptospiraceae bacterium]MBP9886004.1 30S ribosomal protein S9 [Leptospiraceae bacterium]
MAKDKGTWTVGRRKTSVARLKLTDGTGKITVNKKDIKDYIKTGEAKVAAAIAPLTVLNVKDKYDLLLNVHGGGVTGQVEAIRHAIARALSLKSAESRSILKKEGFLTRDSRMVERKKYGLHKARRGTQFSKR